MPILRKLEYKWIVGIVFVFGLSMDLLDMTITNVALPSIARDMGLDPQTAATSIQWVVTGYLLALAVVVPISGWLGDRFGTKRIFMLALLIFTSASLACGLAWSIESLILFRICQGVGGGMLTPVGTAMLFRAFPPHERAHAGAILTIPVVVAPATGPVIGGYLVEYYDWRLIFLINIPVGLMALAFAGVFLREERQPQAGRLDVPGFLLAASGLGLLMYALAEAGAKGLDDPTVIAVGAVGLALLAVFTLVELRVSDPMIDIRLFENRLFTSTNLVQVISYAGLMGGLFLLPLLLQAEMGFSPLESGLATFPQAIGITLMVQAASRLYGRVGPRRMMMFGLTGVTLTTVAFAFIQLDTSDWAIRGVMLVRGFFFAFLLVPLQSATFATISHQMMGRASAVANALRQVGASFGVALLATVLTASLAANDTVLGTQGSSQATLDAFHESFLVAAVLTAFGAVAAFFVSDKEAAVSMAKSEEAEPVPAGH